MKKLNIFFASLGLLSLLVSCEKDETRVELRSTPVPPSIVQVPAMLFTRADGADTLEFKCTAVDPGFVASANYFLEADSAGNDFKNPVILANGISPLSFIKSVSDINGILIKRFPTDVSSTAELRIRAVLVLDAGTGYEPIISISETTTVPILTYGLLRLDLMGPAVTQKIESSLGDGKYSGLVKFNTAEPFTLLDPETGNNYGFTAGTLALGGDPLTPPANGWHKFTVDVNDLTYKIESFQIGLVGTATPNGWDTPDQKMDYDAKTDTWRITITLVDGLIKFRFNDAWAWNLGGLTLDNFVHNGADFPVTAGNYTIILTITNFTQGSETAKVEFKKNN